MISNRISPKNFVTAVTRHCLLAGMVAGMGTFGAQAAGQQTVKMTLQAKKGHFAEQCFMLERGQQVSYQLSTPHPIDFNVHHHTDDGKTLFPDRLLVTSQHSKQIVADSGGEYCFMATNAKDQAGPFEVVIKYEISAS